MTRRFVEARVPVPVRRAYTPAQWRRVIRAGMHYRRTRRFSPTFAHRDRQGNVIVIEEDELVDLGGEGG